MKVISWLDIDVLIARRFVELALENLTEAEYIQRFEELHWLKRNVWDMSKDEAKQGS